MERTETQWIANWLKEHPDRDEDSARSEWESLSVEIRPSVIRSLKRFAQSF